MVKVLKFIPEHWWYFSVLWGIFSMLDIQAWEGACIKLAALSGIFFLVCLKPLKVSDLLVIVYILYCLFSGFVFSSSDVFDAALTTQIYPIAFYFIGRSPYFSDNKYIDNLKLPLLFAMVCALYLYLASPDWYVNWKTSSWKLGNEYNTDMIYERMRLSGFWCWSYYLGYLSLFYVMYLLKRYLIDDQKDKYLFLQIALCGLVLFLAQQRVSIAFFGLYIVLLYVFCKKNNKKNTKVLVVLAGIILSLAIIILVILYFIGDSSLIDYIVNRSVNRDGSLIKERVGLYDNYFQTISFLGAGIGAHSHYVLSMGKDSITDCDYIRLLNEVGVVGFSILIVILLLSLGNSLQHIKRAFFEFSIILFLFISMIGADPLEVPGLHTVIYWYCIGRACSYSKTNAVNRKKQI